MGRNQPLAQTLCFLNAVSVQPVEGSVALSIDSSHTSQIAKLVIGSTLLHYSTIIPHQTKSDRISVALWKRFRLYRTLLHLP